MKKNIIYIMFGIAIIIILIGIFLLQSPKKINTNNSNDEIKESVSPESERTKIKLNQIETSDKTIIIKETNGSFLYNLFAMSVTVVSSEHYSELYLMVDFDLGEKKESIPLIIENIEANKEYETEVQSNTDLTKSKSWSVRKVTKEDILSTGFQIE